ncbi:MAG: response regulator [Sedimentisphaerales bacterium]|nr:response regulator [Sedimentisphaerales bacterium]
MMEKAKILIVDDDPDITEAMKIVLENHDYVVNSVEGIEQAMESLKAERPNLIILDVMMKTPQDGFILSRQLKDDDNYKDIPILMLTAVQEKTGLDFAPAAGDETWLPVDEFMDKPVKPDMLLKKVETLLKKA